MDEQMMRRIERLERQMQIYRRLCVALGGVVVLGLLVAAAPRARDATIGKITAEEIVVRKAGEAYYSTLTPGSVKLGHDAEDSGWAEFYVTRHDAELVIGLDNPRPGAEEWKIRFPWSPLPQRVVSTCGQVITAWKFRHGQTNGH